MNYKKLIVNADDFGLTDEMNMGIIKAFRKGIVTSVSIVPNGQAFDGAIKLVKENKNLDIGVHLCLTEEYPLLSKNTIPTLTDPDGRFYRNWKILLLKLYFRKINLSEIEKEFDAQINKVIDAGIYPSHIDSHQHVHVLPRVYNIVIKLAKKYKIGYIRYPKENLSFGYHSLKKYMLLIPLIFIKRKNKDNSIIHSDHFLGISTSGKLTFCNLIKFLKSLKPGITEIVCHPGEKMLNCKYEHWGYRWEEELKSFSDSRLKLLIRDLNIILIGRSKLNEKF